MTKPHLRPHLTNSNEFQPPLTANTPETGLETPTHLAPLLPAHTQSSPPNFVWGNLDGQQFTMLLDTKVVHWRRNCFSVPSGQRLCEGSLWIGLSPGTKGNHRAPHPTPPETKQKI